VKITKYEALYDQIVSIFLPLGPSRVQIFSAPCFRTLSFLVLPLS